MSAKHRPLLPTMKYVAVIDVPDVVGKFFDEAIAQLLAKIPHFVDRSQQMQHNWSSPRKTRSSA